MNKNFMVVENATIVTFSNDEGVTEPYILTGDLIPLESRQRGRWYYGHNILATAVTAVKISQTDHEGLCFEKVVWGKDAFTFIREEDDNVRLKKEAVKETPLFEDGIIMEGRFKGLKALKNLNNIPEMELWYSGKIDDSSLEKAKNKYEKIKAHYDNGNIFDFFILKS